jgi:hypothetical protein
MELVVNKEFVMETVSNPVQRVLQPIEVVLSTYKTTLFLIAYLVVGLLWLSGVVHDRFDFIVMMSTLTVGLLISRVNSVKLFGVEVTTDPWMQALQANMIHRQLYPQDYPQPQIHANLTAPEIDQQTDASEGLLSP